nr:family 2 encapsulin nanocompartment cargo protein polyprenyl transferase [Sinosporangium album]
MTDARPAFEVLAWSREVVEPLLRQAVDRLPPPARRIAGYHFGWHDEDGTPTRAGGKAIRPALTLLSARAVGGHERAAAPAAVAVELAHNYSLLHDDLIDADEARRHRPTAWKVFGSAQAILVGDVLHALAFDVLACGGTALAAHGTPLLSSALLDLAGGQCADVAFEARTDAVPVDECLEMVRCKTAALLGGACALGALAGGAVPSQVERMRAFGEQLGLAFQMVDDLLGIWGEPSVTGKPVRADLAQRKKSLPVVAALASGTPAGDELAELYHRDTPLTDAELVRAADLVELAGGRAWAQTQADDRMESALVELQADTLVPGAAAELLNIARLITRRDH